jgi:hypothetical protein
LPSRHRVHRVIALPSRHRVAIASSCCHRAIAFIAPSRSSRCDRVIVVPQPQAALV